ncbi:MAG: hypothetical protein COW42_02455 [Deltaproteobacteria bacterium CG17_big_fil_post_rev_8_21_14_2_50_63_7]|nr:MAG: hypothetical protein COW42_02455 [Deltaproteobacteria bacterium CG17_big_fil_post_rev_8_21_14_2_50_63_7]
MPVMLRDMGVVVTFVAGAGWLLFQRDAAVAFDGRGVASFLYLGLVASAAASGLYLVLLRRYRVSALSYLQFVSALVAVVVGAFLTGTRFTSLTVGGTLAVLAGLAVLARAQTRR